MTDRTRLVQTRISRELAKQIESAAAAVGMSVATWLRVLLLERFELAIATEQSALAAAAIEAARKPPRRCSCGGARERTTGRRWNLVCTRCGRYSLERRRR